MTVAQQLDLDTRWFPETKIKAPPTFDLKTLRHEFMLDDSATTTHNRHLEDSPTESSKHEQSRRYLIEVFDTRARSRQAPAAMQMPRLKCIYRGPNPGQIYDLAAIKFTSNYGSRLWLSDSIPGGSNYFLNMTRISVAHAAATKGSSLLHSALVEHNGLGILLPGGAFSGKSSIAVFAMLTGATLVSDDLVLVSNGNGGATAARSFRRTLLMRERTHQLLPESIRVNAQSASIGGVTKYAYDRDALRGLTGIETDVHRIVLPSISSSAIRCTEHGYKIRSIDKASAIQQLVQCLDSSVLMPGLENERSKVTSGLLNLVARTPCMDLKMDSTFLNAPRENCHRLLNDIANIDRSATAANA